MLRSIAILSALAFLISPAIALPLSINQVGSINDGMLKVRMTKSNVCKHKYKFKKSAQDLREKAHCK
jgi:hypothetical protein